MSSSVRLSVVCNVRAPYSGDWNFRQRFYAMWYLGHPDVCIKILTEIVLGEPLRRGLNPRGVVKYIAILDPLKAISPKRCKISHKLVLITNSKSQKLSIGTKLGDLEWPWKRNSPNDCVITSNSVAFWADYIKVVEDTPILSAAEM